MRIFMLIVIFIYMLILIIIVIVIILTYLYFLTYTCAYLFLKYSELEKCRCVPQIAFRDKKFQQTSCFYTDVLKTRERSLCTSDWVPGNKISKQQGFGHTRLNPTCFDIVVYLKWGSAEISKKKQQGFRSTRLNPTCFEYVREQNKLMYSSSAQNSRKYRCVPKIGFRARKFQKWTKMIQSSWD